MYYTDKVFYKVIWKNPLKPIVEEYTSTRLTAQGKLWYGICPFHNESSPSFSVDNSKNTFFCFGCGESGNVVDFIMKVKKCTFIEAMELLAARANIQLPQVQPDNEGAVILRENEIAMKYYVNNLYGHSNKITPGMKYLSKRGLSSDTIQSFNLGYVGDYGSAIYNRLIRAGFTKDEILRSKLSDIDESGKIRDRFWNRVMFPISNVDGDIIGFGGRILGDGKPKYLNSPETVVFDKGSNLYALNIAKNDADNGIILAEGYMDVISLHQAGFKNTVASLGTALTGSQAALIKKYTQTVYVAYDSDEPGVKATLKAIPILARAGLDVKIIKMPGAKDPDEFILRFGRGKFVQQIKNAESAERFSVQNNPFPYEKAIDLFL